MTDDIIIYYVLCHTHNCVYDIIVYYVKLTLVFMEEIIHSSAKPEILNLSDSDGYKMILEGYKRNMRVV